MFAIFEPNSAIGVSTPNRDLSLPQRPQEKSGRRREKPQLSCNNCRQKKLKCDRMKPCDNCAKRRQSCDYTTRPVPRATKARKATGDVHDRVQQLEDMIKSLINNQAVSAENLPAEEKAADLGHECGFIPSPAASPAPSFSVGKFTKTKDQVSFVGSEHWESVLEDIRDLKIDLESSDMAENVSETVDFKPQLLFGTDRPSIAELLSSIPPRAVCDILVSRWFKAFSMASMVVHVPTFTKEYNEMFRDPNETPLMWFGLFFSVLGMASFFYAASGEELHSMPKQFSSTWEMCRHFRDRTAQCLVEVNYLIPKRYTLETLCFYHALEKFPARDYEFGSYVLLGMVVRIAMRLGYHRDARHYPNISPFDGEMRRRVWCMIYQLDLIASAQVGLPRMIHQEETDTAEPKNLLDADFNEDATELPRPRPVTDVTPVAYAIFMVRLLRQLGRIVDQSNSVTTPSYDEVMRLDSELLKTHSSLPPYLTMRPLSDSLTDDADVILRRCALEVYFQKSRCVLHRKYLILGKSNAQFRYSRTSSIDGAMRLLTVQSMFYNATQSGGQLFGEQWRTSALINQDYILASMILCLDLASSTTTEATPSSENEGEIDSLWPRYTRLQSVKDGYAIWSKLSHQSAVAAKAADALKVMLKKVEVVDSKFTPKTVASSSIDTFDADKSTWSVQDMSWDAASNPKRPQANGPTIVASPSNVYFNTQDLVGSLGTDFLEGTTDAEMNFDWELWDSQWNNVPYGTEMQPEP